MDKRSLVAWSAGLTAVVLIALAVWVGRPAGTSSGTPEPTVVRALQPTVASAAQPTVASVAQPVVVTATQSLTSTTTYTVSADQADTLALAAVPGAKLTGATTLVSFQNVPAYEVTLDAGLIYVDASTGMVLNPPTTTSGAFGGFGGGEGGEGGERGEGGEGRERGEGR